jgi:hypothetical protein
MSKKSIVMNTEDFLEAVKEKSFSIMEASIKDDLCNYTFKVTSGVGSGDSHSVKGSGIIEEDMRAAFRMLNVHLAAIDDVFNLSKIELEDIDNYHAHELATRYHVTGVKIKGGSENETIILIGSKYVGTAGGRIELATPRIPMDNLSSYNWYNELQPAFALWMMGFPEDWTLLPFQKENGEQKV